MRKSKKIRRLIKSAKMGKASQMYLLGIEYQLGKYVPQDMEKACYWITLASENGYSKAIEWLNDYHFDDDANTQANS